MDMKVQYLHDHSLASRCYLCKRHTFLYNTIFLCIERYLLESCYLQPTMHELGLPGGVALGPLSRPSNIVWEETKHIHL